MSLRKVSYKLSQSFIPGVKFQQKVSNFQKKCLLKYPKDWFKKSIF